MLIKRLLRNALITLIIISACIMHANSSVAFDMQEEEMDILRMYYMEDELVLAPTRTPKHLSQVAENVSVITAEDISNMKAHTVNEVLDRVTGAFVEFQGRDFEGSALVKIQGSDQRHVLFLLDGMMLNNISTGESIVTGIPVEIIKRIEIIKGPASSAWGSSLGGVVNIVTKDIGEDPVTGAVRASYGDGDSQDYRADVSGRTGMLGYYLYAGRQFSNGIDPDKEYENHAFYSKLHIPMHDDLDLTLTAGYQDSFSDFGLSGFDATGDVSHLFFTTTVQTTISDRIRAEASAYYFQIEFISDTEQIGGVYYRKGDTEERTYAGNAKIIYDDGVHNAVIGIDAKDIRNETLDDRFDGFQNVRTDSNPGITKWALYMNDTISRGGFTITPGIRYDSDNISGSFVSPSIGITQRFLENHIFRASIARGFTSPGLGFINGGGFRLVENPDLKPESVWSYQAGVETRSVYHKGKVSFFYHDQEDGIVTEPVSETLNKKVNKARITREGLECELETSPFHNFRLNAGFTYALIKNHEDDVNEDRYAVNTSLIYDDRDAFRAELAGSYLYLDTDIHETAENAMLWDLILAKKIGMGGAGDVELFFTAHNMFNGRQYPFPTFENPDRWVEGGIKVMFH